MAPNDEDMGYEDVDYGVYCVSMRRKMVWRILGGSNWAVSAQADFHLGARCWEAME